MEILNATDAKREFGEVLLKAQREPVAINKNGKPVAVMVSAEEYESLISSSKKMLMTELQKGFDDLHNGRVNDGKEIINHLMEQARNAQL